MSFSTRAGTADQVANPEVSIESFVGHSSMGLLCLFPLSKNVSVI